MQELVDVLLIEDNTVIDEISTNDYGTLAYVSERTDMKVHVGRLLFKNYRDPRYDDFYNCKIKPNFVSDYSKRIIHDFEIAGIELDPIAKEIDLRDADPELIYSLHVPYCYVTTGQICEFNSMNKPLEQRYRPGMACNQECKGHSLEYHLQEQIIMTRKGKAVFFRNDFCNIHSDVPIRYIWDASEYIRKS